MLIANCAECKLNDRPKAAGRRGEETELCLVEIQTPVVGFELMDGLQSLTPSDFARLMEELRAIAKSVGRYI